MFTIEKRGKFYVVKKIVSENVTAIYGKYRTREEAEDRIHNLGK